VENISSALLDWFYKNHRILQSGEFLLPVQDVCRLEIV
jgi:hypothetical protein